MQNNQSPTFLGILTRMGWMLFGPVLLIAFAVLVVRTGNGWLTVWDFAFLAALGGVVLARWLEFRCGCPQTAEGEPATPAHLRRYAIGVLGLGLLVWIAANVIGNGYLSR